MRKIKAFNVEEETYKRLLSMIKKYKVNASLSSFVNTCLEELLCYLQEVEAVRKKYPDSKLPLSFVITEMTKSLLKMKSVPPVLFGEKRSEEEVREHFEGELLTKWEDEYEAQQRGISVEMYSYLKEGGYFLSQNKQYLISEKTGKKYMPFSSAPGRSILLEITDSEGNNA